MPKSQAAQGNKNKSLSFLQFSSARYCCRYSKNGDVEEKYYVQFTNIHEMLSKGGFNSEMRLALEYQPLKDQLQFFKTNSEWYEDLFPHK